MKKKLLTCGCSYTNIRNTKLYPASEKEKPKYQEYWPNYLADDLGLECINAGASGAGNDAIFNQAIKYISEYDYNEIELICVLWTQMFRVNLWNWSKYTDTISTFTHGCKDMGGQDPIIYDIAERLLDKLEEHFWLDKFIFNYFNNITILTQLCNRLGIKLIMAQAMKFEPGAGGGWSDLCDNKYFFAKFSEEVANIDINTKHFIAWPPVRALGGHPLQDNDQELFKLENRISKRDWHPNAKGHRIIADEYLKKYKEIYS